MPVAIAQEQADPSEAHGIGMHRVRESLACATEGTVSVPAVRFVGLQPIET